MKRILIGLVLMPLLGGVVHAGENATRFWQIFEFNWKPVKGLRLEVEKQVRYRDTFADVDSDITGFSGRYKVSGWLHLAAGYRYTALGDETRHRLYSDLHLRWRQDTFTVTNRARLQKEFFREGNGNSSGMVFRDRLEVSFLRGRKLRPYAGGEIFLGLDEQGKKENKYRLTAGLDFRMTKQVRLSLFYHYQHDMGEKVNETDHILGGCFRYSF